MPVNIDMPKLSDTMTEGTLVSWKKKEGEEVSVGDVIAEIETDKATMEMEAFEDGVIAKIFVKKGEKVPIGQRLAVLAEEDESIEEALASLTPSSDHTPQADTPLEPSTDMKVEVDGSDKEDSDRIKVSPLARKLAKKEGLTLSRITGTGPGGRIVKADIMKAKNSSSESANIAPSAMNIGTSVQAIMPVGSEEDKRVPLSSMRKIIANRLLTSKLTIPHFYLHVECEVSAMMELRKQVNEQALASNGNKYTVNDFITKALIEACRAVPAVNASYAGGHIIEFKDVGVSIAIAIEDGLVTPVVKNAQTKSLLEISKEVKDLASRARDKKLKPNEFDGGTITISNLGSYGIDSFDAIVNPPQAAILSVGGIITKPIVKGDQITIGKTMNLGLSCDHRVVDGAVAATFLNKVKKLIETPTLMLL